MKVLIVGSRNIRDFDLSDYVPSDTELIISGGAVGMDAVAERYADQHKIPKLIIRPDYEKYGRSAPLKRNDVMVDHADLVIAVWDGVSRGTKYTIDRAEKKNKAVKLIRASNKLSDEKE